MGIHLLAISILGKQIAWNDVLDIVVVAFLIYQLLLIVRGTGAVQAGLGVVLLIFIFFLSRWLGLKTLQWTLTKIVPYLFFLVIVLFQHEIRKAFSILGQSPFANLFSGKPSRQPLDEIILAVTSMASKQIGAIVVLERETGLKNYIEGGVTLDAKVSYDLLMSIFNPGSPLHDGAVIIQGDRATAAACFLPLTLNPFLARELGSRHRAAIGLSEETDALIIVVSEETGKIGLVQHEEMISDLDGTDLKRRIQESWPLDRKALVRKIFRKDISV